MLRILTKKFHRFTSLHPCLVSFNFSWIAKERYKGKDPDAESIKANAKESILKRLGQKDIDKNDIDIMISLMYQELKGKNSNKTKDLLCTKNQFCSNTYYTYYLLKLLTKLLAKMCCALLSPPRRAGNLISSMK